jgi:hypothetical protein
MQEDSPKVQYVRVIPAGQQVRPAARCAHVLSCIGNRVTNGIRGARTTAGDNHHLSTNCRAAAATDGRVDGCRADVICVGRLASRNTAAIPTEEEKLRS